jgi:hypothetical protein
MSSTGPTAGWYSDPGNPGGALRWWDGAQWTAQTQGLPSAGPPSVSPYGSGSPTSGAVPQMSYGQAPATPDPGAPMSYGAAPGQFPNRPGQFPQAQPGQFPQAQPPSYGPGVGMGRGRGMASASMMGGSFWRRNQASLTATGVAAVYVVLAVSAHFVFLGIVPVVMCMRAFQRRETLAPLALVAAIAAVGMAVLFFR